ncbi:hypothetical protein [Chryseobacterium sp. MA9]|uniref:hypothetical protein n=1 Tax=Chryseobacterium sp. MA9 TaxID=2966625 RepID=UPI0021080D43|nr:hypothetical protein [Chryseobacterium sp. MA9]UTX48898.1 hypothetical protein KIK00_01110 [Chryseobacterium sp. MA9]UTX48899.1 hypothetical protein KIK00_01115 [Chryseobacterium sp. MA9]
MKKTFIILLTLIFSNLVYSQVGINTTTPTASLDIVSKNPTGTATNIDGILIPRVDRERAQNMAAVPNSTLIYINDISTGSQTGAAINIDNVGFYYFDTVWTKLGQSNSIPIQNIFLADGTSSSVVPSNFVAGSIGVGYHQFQITLPTTGRCKFDIYPSAYSPNINGIGTRFYIDNVLLSTVQTAITSPSSTHIIVPYSYVTPSKLTQGLHTIRIQASTNSIIDQNDRLTYSYMCWN